MTTLAVIVAGGTGVRASGTPDSLPKQFRRLGGASMLDRALAPFLAHPRVDAVQVVIRAGLDSVYAASVVAHPKLLSPVSGGDRRQDSVRAGLEAAAGAAAMPDLVLIHDAARPFVSRQVIGRVLDALDSGPAAIPAIPVADTLKRSSAAGMVDGTVDRTGLFAAQTPQGFRFPDILEAHRAAAGSGREFTDDAAIAEWAGLPVAIVAGDPANRKITTPEDIQMAESTLSRQGAANPEYRTGNGFDVHRFGPGDHVVLCGVRIPHGQGLVGHSDADVGLHALTDALLGAIADGDIGSHFPPSDPQWRGADSAQFLAHAGGLVAARDGRIVHADVTLICEAPRVGPHREAMRARIAGILGVSVDRISVKATTSEGLGFTGRREGIAAQATATVALPGDSETGGTE